MSDNSFTMKNLMYDSNGVYTHELGAPREQQWHQAQHQRDDPWMDEIFAIKRS